MRARSRRVLSAASWCTRWNANSLIFASELARLKGRVHRCRRVGRGDRPRPCPRSRAAAAPAKLRRRAYRVSRRAASAVVCHVRLGVGNRASITAENDLATRRGTRKREHGPRFHPALSDRPADTRRCHSRCGVGGAAGSCCARRRCAIRRVLRLWRGRGSDSVVLVPRSISAALGCPGCRPDLHVRSNAGPTMHTMPSWPSSFLLPLNVALFSVLRENGVTTHRRCPQACDRVRAGRRRRVDGW